MQFRLQMVGNQSRNRDRESGSVDFRAASHQHGVKITLRLKQPGFHFLLPAAGHRNFARRRPKGWQGDLRACPLGLSETALWPMGRRKSPSLLASFLLHISAGYFLLRIPLPEIYHAIVPPPQVAKVVSVEMFEFHRLSLPEYLPAVGSLEPAEAQSTPPAGSLGLKLPARQATCFDPRVTIFSNRPRPDNFRAMLQSPAFPSEAKGPADLRIPDLFLGRLRPTPPLSPTRANPGPTTPSQRYSKPRMMARRHPKRNTLAGVATQSTLERLSMAKPPGAGTRVGLSPGSGAGGDAAAPDIKRNRQPTPLTALSVDPVPLKELSALPTGNRAGAFSIGAGGRNGAPAVANADATLSVSGPAAAPALIAGSLPPLEPSSLVYPLKESDIRSPAPSVVVSSGSGGGGLPAYGVLHGGRVYTVYIAMPGKSWILQYAVHVEAPKLGLPQRVIEIHIQPAIAPPACLVQFDFHRPTAGGDPAREMIILHGLIGEDGAVVNLEIFQGVEPVLNEAARTAFGRWKFRPALEEGRPVEVEILVGIPPVGRG